MFKAQNLYYQTGGRTLIHPLSLTLSAGEMTVIIGPNGAGKSTLLKLLTGYLPANQGECYLFDKPLTDWNLNELAKIRAVMRQQSNLNFPFTVEEVVTMGRIPYHKQHLKQAVEQSLIQTDCWQLRHRYFNQLSGGEQQRAQLARVLTQLWQPAASPRLLFLDEPTSAFDLYHQQNTLRLIKQLTKTQSLSVCCVLHDLNLASLYADRILLLHQGKMVAEGSPKEVLKKDILQQWYQAELDVGTHPMNALPLVYLHQ